MNGYIALYRGEKIEVYAETALKTREEAARKFKARKSYEVSVYLAEMNGATVTQVITN